MTRSIFGHLTCALLLCAASATLAAKDAAWTSAWTAAPDSAGPALHAQTVRQIVRVGIGGSSLRIRLSNAYGTGPVTIGSVHVAVHAQASAIHEGSDRAVTFAGQPTLILAKGADGLSDPVALPVSALEELAVSLYVPGRVATSTLHGTGMQTAYLTESGDAAAATVFASSETSSSRFFLTEVQVTSGAPVGALVVMGDSIADGVGSTPDRNARWPDVLAERLHAAHAQDDRALVSIAVVNAGIAGNRLLRGEDAPYIGVSGLSRLDHDALDKPGVRWLLLDEGINDISAGSVLPTPADDVSAERIIDGMRRVIARAHAKGIKVWGATLLPFAGAEWPFHSTAGEAKRAVVNAWIRHGGAFDAVIDFERVARDPAHPNRIRPEYDSGDHIHLNDAGYRALAASIDLGLFARAR